MKSNEIGEVLKQGRASKTGSFLLKTLILQGKNKKRPQIAYIAGKKLFKTAVSRNKVRRKMRAALQPFLKKMSKKACFVFSLHPEILTKPQKELIFEVENILKKDGMLRD